MPPLTTGAIARRGLHERHETGFDDGAVRCAADCTYDDSACTRCGDGIAQGDEACDGADTHGVACTSLGFTGGDLVCTETCDGLSTASCTGAAACPADDGFEPNNPAALAVQLPFHADAVRCAEDDDHYSFVVVEGDRLLIDLAFAQAQGNLDFVLLDHTSSPVAEGKGMLDSEHADVVVPAGAGGTWTLAVVAAGGAANNYHLDTIDIRKAAPVSGWLCNANWYATDDGCDCGCGLFDPDCADATRASCEYCADDGSCGLGDCSNIDPSNNAICQ